MNVYGKLCINYVLIFYLNYQVTYPRAKRVYHIYLCTHIFKQRNPDICLFFYFIFYKSNHFLNRTCRRSTPLYAKHGQMGTVSTEPLVSHIWSLYSKTAKNYIGNHLPAYVRLNEHYLFIWLNKLFSFYKTGY